MNQETAAGRGNKGDLLNLRDSRRFCRRQSGWLSSQTRDAHAPRFQIEDGAAVRVDRKGRRRLLRLQLIALVLALLWLAASRTASWLLSGMLLAGLLGTALTQGLIAYTATLAPPEQRGRMVGVVQGGVFIGLLLARVVSGTVAAAFGWQMVYLLSAVMMAALAALLWQRLPAVTVPSVPPR